VAQLRFFHAGENLPEILAGIGGFLEGITTTVEENVDAVGFTDDASLVERPFRDLGEIEFFQVVAIPSGEMEMNDGHNRNGCVGWVMASITLKNIPEDLHAVFKRRAEKNRRSLQAEILWVMENASFAFPEEEKLEVKDLAGILKYDGPAVSIEEMEAGIGKMFQETWKK